MSNRFTSSDVRAFWDSVADIYDIANDRVRGIHDQRYRESLTYFPAVHPDTVLNIWSRTGEAVSFLEAHDITSKVINLEVSSRLIQKGLRAGRSGTYVQTDLMAIPIRSGSVGLVLSLETLEHCPDPRLFLREIHRVLKPGGALIMSCPPALAEITLWIYERFAFNHGEGPHRFLSSRTVKALLSQSGFNLLDHRGTLFLPFGNPTIQKMDKLLERPLNRLGLSDLGLRQFFHARATPG